jgi:3'(2'), 5'-bisphosphate nucleotidase
MDKLLPQVVSIAREAGLAIMEVYADPTNNVMTKEDDSPLTQADLAADRIIKAGLQNLQCGWPVLSEESAQIPYAVRKDWSCFWLVDPLDGTKEFVKRNGEFTVNIALIENGLPILGVVFAPALNVCYYAAGGVGAFIKRGEDTAQSIQAKPPSNGEVYKVVSSRSHADESTTELMHKLGKHQCISMGSSLKLCLVAEGLAHFYPRLGPTMEWDTAAAHAVVIAANAVVNDRFGNSLIYNKPDLHNSEFFVYFKTDLQVKQLIASIS